MKYFVYSLSGSYFVGQAVVGGETETSARRFLILSPWFKETRETDKALQIDGVEECGAVGVMGYFVAQQNFNDVLDLIEKSAKKSKKTAEERAALRERALDALTSLYEATLA